MTIYYSPSARGFYDTEFTSYSLPADIVQITKSQRDALLAGEAQGQVISMVNGVPSLIPASAPAPTKTSLCLAATTHIDAAAIRKGYESAAVCVSYIGDPVTAWNADGLAMRAWRSDAWTYVIAQLALVTLPTESALLSGIDALPSNPKW